VSVIQRRSIFCLECIEGCACGGESLVVVVACGRPAMLRCKYLFREMYSRIHEGSDSDSLLKSIKNPLSISHTGRSHNI